MSVTSTAVTRVSVVMVMVVVVSMTMGMTLFMALCAGSLSFLLFLQIVTKVSLTRYVTWYYPIHTCVEALFYG